MIPLMMALALAAAPAGSVDTQRPASPDALVQIDAPSGSLKVVGWDREMVQVTGTYGRQVESVTVTGPAHRIHIEVETERGPESARADLEVHVPTNARVEAETYGADIDVSGVRGRIRAETVQGQIHIAGGAEEVSAETVQGTVDIECPCTRTHAESVNGPVTVRGAGGELEASTVNGQLRVDGGRITRGHLETVNGSIHFSGELAAHATLDISNVSGSVELVLPASTGADFSISGMNARLRNDLGSGPTSMHARGGDEDDDDDEMEFSVGGGGATVSIETLNGEVHLARRTSPSH